MTQTSPNYAPTSAEIEKLKKIQIADFSEAVDIADFSEAVDVAWQEFMHTIAQCAARAGGLFAR